MRMFVIAICLFRAIRGREFYLGPGVQELEREGDGIGRQEGVWDGGEGGGLVQEFHQVEDACDEGPNVVTTPPAALTLVL